MAMHQVWENPNPPFSFEYGGRPAAALIPGWHREETTQPSPGGQTTHRRYRDPATGLVVTAHLRRFDAFPALDWVLELENTGRADTPIIDHLLPLDVSWAWGRGEQVVLHWAKGSECVADDFLPVDEVLRPGRELRLAPNQGRSSDGVLPFMNLQCPGGGVVLAIGWSGQWAAALARSEENLRISAGMEHCRLYLKPGEKIRTPRILLIGWQGEEAMAGNNLLRRLLLTHYCPRLGGELVIPPVAHMTMSTYHKTCVVTREGELAALGRIADLGGEAFWVDACWYGSGGRWWEEVGNWNVRQDQFPEGLGFIGEAAHVRGMKFVLWFEPERVRTGTPIEREHPEFLLRLEHSPENSLLNLGLPQVQEYIIDAVSRIITASGVDIYRQDFNIQPLPFWQAADAADRVGMTEIRHIEGLYAMWDELLRRHPGLAIDNCSSGGRRIDLETVSRAFPLWRSDFSDVGGPEQGRGLQLGDQSQTAGLSRWVPLHTASVWSFSPYDFRSAMATGVVLYCDIRVEGFPMEDARRAIAELKRLRPYYLGDFHPLLPLTMAAHDWCAYQYHRPTEGDGFAVFLRRHESPFPTMEFALRGIDPEAEYEIGASATFDAPVLKRVRGKTLLQLVAQIDQQPGSLLFQYRRV
ncbi:MAG: alpha-galactosidase [Candidatus Latescibacteria bacterium]|nr:alpha-galactosidase [Candidatus Latescibacterota bacterium]